MDEYLLMDDGGSVILEEMTPEMLAAYEEVKAKILEEYASAAE